MCDSFRFQVGRFTDFLSNPGKGGWISEFDLASRLAKGEFVAPRSLLSPHELRRCLIRDGTIHQPSSLPDGASESASTPAKPNQQNRNHDRQRREGEQPENVWLLVHGGSRGLN